MTSVPECESNIEISSKGIPAFFNSVAPLCRKSCGCNDSTPIREPAKCAHSFKVERDIAFSSLHLFVKKTQPKSSISFSFLQACNLRSKSLTSSLKNRSTILPSFSSTLLTTQLSKSIISQRMWATAFTRAIVDSENMT